MAEVFEGDANCVACEDPLGMHFQSVDGKVRCLVVEHTVSASGVIGLETTHRCDCVNFNSPKGEMKKTRRRKLEEDHLKLKKLFFSVQKGEF